MSCLYPFVTPELIVTELAVNGWSASFGDKWVTGPIPAAGFPDQLSSENHPRFVWIRNWFRQCISTNNISTPGQENVHGRNDIHR